MKNNSANLEVHAFIKGAIREAMKKALKAKPIKIHHYPQNIIDECNFFEIDGEIYDCPAAIEKILGEYSWWRS